MARSERLHHIDCKTILGRLRHWHLITLPHCLCITLIGPRAVCGGSEMPSSSEMTLLSPRPRILQVLFTRACTHSNSRKSAHLLLRITQPLRAHACPARRSASNGVTYSSAVPQSVRPSGSAPQPATPSNRADALMTARWWFAQTRTTSASASAQNTMPKTRPIVSRILLISLATLHVASSQSTAPGAMLEWCRANLTAAASPEVVQAAHFCLGASP